MAKSFLLFRELAQQARKTKSWDVTSSHNECHLGYITWHGPWRKYCFMPNASTVFDPACLEEIYHFLKAEQLNHSIELKARKANA